MFGLWTLMLH